MQRSNVGGEGGGGEVSGRGGWGGVLIPFSTIFDDLMDDVHCSATFAI